MGRSDWKFIKILGTGDFAQVDLVESSGIMGALKPAPMGNSSAVRRLQLEADALAQLSHPGIPKLLETGLEEEAPFIVMSVAKGRTLRSIVEEWNDIGRRHGSIETLRILRSVVAALEHIHEAGLVHRDIKDANVLVDHASFSATFIDFGFAKKHGESDMRDKDSLWRVGAMRFSPPMKLERPGYADKSHDVFAAGVLAYLMLTGEFPWSVESVDDVGVYRRHLLSTQLVPPQELNSTVPFILSSLVSQMLGLADDSRPTASEVLRSLDEVERSLNEFPSRRSSSVATYPHVVRDPLHGDIRLSDFEYQAFNSREMQRLRWIRQLGLANLVYPGADHSRLLHSVGSLHRAETILRTIETDSGLRIDATTRQAVRLYALVHDVSHISMGHTIEDQLGYFVRHDENEQRFARLVGVPESDLGSVLRSSEVGLEVLTRLDPNTPADRSDFVSELISGPMGADALDYLDRDAYFCGLDHRVDSAIFRQLKLFARDEPANRRLVSSNTGKYGVRIDRVFALESLLIERYAMFLKVYTHSAKLAADAVLGKALHALSLQRNGLREPEMEWLGDESLIDLLRRSRNATVQDMGRRLRERALPRGVYRARLLGDNQLDSRAYNNQIARIESENLHTPLGRAKMEKRVADSAGVDVARVFVYCPPRAPGYKRANQWFQDSAQASPRSADTSEEKGISSRHLALWECWVFLAEGTERERGAVAEAAEVEFNRANAIADYRRPSLLTSGL